MVMCRSDTVSSADAAVYKIASYFITRHFGLGKAWYKVDLCYFFLFCSVVLFV